MYIVFLAIDNYKKQSVFFEVDGAGSEEAVNMRLETAMQTAIKQVRA